MQVAFYATLRDVVGAKRVELDLAEDPTVLGLLKKVEKRYPGMGELIWDVDGRLRDYVKVFVDGRESRHLQGLATPIGPDAEVDIFPPSAGG